MLPDWDGFTSGGSRTNNRVTSSTVSTSQEGRGGGVSERETVEKVSVALW